MQKPSSARQAIRGIEINSAAAVEHLLQHHPKSVLSVSLGGNAATPRLQEIQRLAKSARVAVDASAAAETVRALVAPFQYRELSSLVEALKDKPRVTLLALDHLQDPHNFGALCRTAVGLGIDGILIPKDRAVAVTAGVYASSVGTVQSIPIVQANLGEALRKLKEKNYWILGTAIGPESKPPWEAPDFEKAVLVLGAELEGLSSGIHKLCDWQVAIPITPRVQSYNVSVAGAILMYEWQRRQFTTPQE